jgi:hypothetical protein
MVASGDPPKVDRWSRRAKFMLFAVIALPVAAYFTGNLYGPVDFEGTGRPPIFPVSLDDLRFLFSVFFALLVLSSLASLVVTALAIRLGARLSARVNSAIAGYTPIGLILVMAALTIAVYVIGYGVGNLSSETAHSCVTRPFVP